MAQQDPLFLGHVNKQKLTAWPQMTLKLPIVLQEFSSVSVGMGQRNSTLEVRGWGGGVGRK